MLKSIVLLVSVNVMALGPCVVWSQDYPNRPIRIVTSAAGGSNDLTTRVIAQGLTGGSLGQPVLVDNRGSGVLPGLAVLQAPPDGYTMLMAGTSFMIGHLLRDAPFDPERDFSPVCLLAMTPNLVLVHPSLPVKSVKELIALAQARPKALNYSSSGTGSTQQLSAELFKAMAGANIVRVDYKGGGPGMIGLMSGETQVMFNPAPTSAPHIKSGKVRALAVTSAQPSAMVPGLPTVSAAGVPGYEVVSVDTIFVRAKTPAAIINRLNQEIVRFLNRPDVKEKFFTSGSEVIAGSPEALGTLMRSELVKWGKLIKDAGIKAE